MEKILKDKTASIKARLLGIASRSKLDFDSLLLRYMQERFLYRLMLSGFSDNFILKGGFLLICLNMPWPRTTKDVDFLARGLKNVDTEFETIFGDIAAIPDDDGVHFDVSSIFSESIIENSDYKGIRIKLDAFLGKARKSLQFDIGFGDSIWPEPVTLEFPSLLEGMNPKLRAYPVESIIAEKFEIMLKLEALNSRMKDFYDIYCLSHSYDFSGEVLKCAIESTLKTRQTVIAGIPVIFRKEFRDDRMKQKQWGAFLRKTRLENVSKDFAEIMKRVTDFLMPISLSINGKETINTVWERNEGTWAITREEVENHIYSSH